MSELMDGMLGGPAERSLRQQAEDLMPRLRMFKVISSTFNNDNSTPHRTETTVVANSMNLADGKVVFFTLRFVEPNQLIGYVTRIIGGTIIEAEDLGELPESKIIN